MPTTDRQRPRAAGGADKAPVYARAVEVGAGDAVVDRPVDEGVGAGGEGEGGDGQGGERERGAADETRTRRPLDEARRSGSHVPCTHANFGEGSQ